MHPRLLERLTIVNHGLPGRAPSLSRVVPEAREVVMPREDGPVLGCDAGQLRGGATIASGEVMDTKRTMLAGLLVLSMAAVNHAGFAADKTTGDKGKSKASAAESGDVWWKHAVIYEIYPRSFQDSNGDGIGDLNGITSRLDYLKELGVNAIWLTPIYPSPQIDFGYDISNYVAIDPPYGTMADFDRLVAEAKKRDIRVIMDMVMNHTSDKHPWFIESESSKTSSKRDWYVWENGKGPGEPPNNWQSAFGHSAWQYSPKTDQWYYHKFYIQQPDLNWRNPKVEQAM